MRREQRRREEPDRSALEVYLTQEWQHGSWSSGSDSVCSAALWPDVFCSAVQPASSISSLLLRPQWGTHSAAHARAHCGTRHSPSTAGPSSPNSPANIASTQAEDPLTQSYRGHRLLALLFRPPQRDRQSGRPCLSTSPRVYWLSESTLGPVCLFTGCFIKVA